MLSPVESCDLATVGAHDPAEGWREVLDRTYVPFDAMPAPAAGERFDVRSVRRRIGDLALVDYQCGRGFGRRGRTEISATPGDLLGFMVLRHGRVALNLDGRSLLLSPGQAAVWDGARRGSFEALTPIAKRTLIVPRERLGAVLPPYERVLARSLRADTPQMRLLTGYLETLAGLAPTLDLAGQAAASDAALELVRGALGESLESDSQGLRAGLLAQVPRYIEEHLSNPDLDPAMIASAHAVSVRTLHQAFEETGESVSALIRRRRLERCRDDLLAQPATSVTEVAFRWGFRDGSHFSRLFRRRFGESPRSLRASARG